MKLVKSLSGLNKLKRLRVVYGIALVVILFISASYLVRLNPYKAVSSSQFVTARVLSVTPAGAGNQVVKAKILEGAGYGHIVSVNRGYFMTDPNSKRLPVGSETLLSVQPKNGDQYSYLDRYRLPGVLTLLAVLLVLVLVIGRWRGMTAAVGLVFSISILAVFVLPRILNGDPAFATCIEGAFMIATLSIFIAHGFNRRTTLAYVSTIVTLGLVVGIAATAVHLTGTTGDAGETINSEQEVPLLQYAPHYIDLAGLFMGGMVIASLGLLEDITTGQAAAIDEIHKANPKLNSIELYKKGLSVGREHIAALINTLAILYAGTALPTIVVTILYNAGNPLAVTINDETIIEAIVRTIVPSIGLLLAVPLSTGLAAYVLPRWYRHRRAI
ncbi:MAG TPA: YibE/F family protein [Candidatus Binatia bacterium]|nr:YibE/F family protein [Candidatus Binatia bacterium]